MTKRLNEIGDELRHMAEHESMKVFRMARRAEKKGCSADLVNAIRNEGHDLYNNYMSYPERLLDWRTKSKLKYAFCGERIKHTYMLVNPETCEIIRMERR